jgi:RHS repeat-associated protein
VDGEDVTYQRTDYLYDEQWQVLEERTDTFEDLEGEGGALATVAETVNVQWLWDQRYIDAPVLRWRDADADPETGQYGLDETLYYCNDANMNVTALVDAETGEVVERYMYDPYGKATVCEEDWTPREGNASAVANDVLYCGYRFDAETGLYNVRYRYYHPTLGRWNSRDPGGYGDGMGLYQYARSSPLVATDPTGLRLLAPEDMFPNSGGGAFYPLAPNPFNTGGGPYGPYNDQVIMPIPLFVVDEGEDDACIEALSQEINDLIRTAAMYSRDAGIDMQDRGDKGRMGTLGSDEEVAAKWTIPGAKAAGGWRMPLNPWAERGNARTPLGGGPVELNNPGYVRKSGGTGCRGIGELMQTNLHESIHKNQQGSWSKPETMDQKRSYGDWSTKDIDSYVHWIAEDAASLLHLTKAEQYGFTRPANNCCCPSLRNMVKDIKAREARWTPRPPEPVDLTSPE